MYEGDVLHVAEDQLAASPVSFVDVSGLRSQLDCVAGIRGLRKLLDGDIVWYLLRQILANVLLETPTAHR
eukprot:CAMPEP_0173240746 /NCGR_PEP_ID=MMETSP1142-20121109/13962_1 /TAXON_ID=483371 /ORGANISM="non described non described, Strain CCMP2298" /LENGTH=69 /DNA_ID=CAMNT_0014171951 /DNA_START=1016 /DNA_END=1221 /DNA_ORIENTATION=-